MKLVGAFLIKFFIFLYVVVKKVDCMNINEKFEHIINIDICQLTRQN